MIKNKLDPKNKILKFGLNLLTTFIYAINPIHKIIKVNKKLLTAVDIPNFIFEYQRIYNPDVFVLSLKNEFLKFTYFNIHIAIIIC